VTSVLGDLIAGSEERQVAGADVISNDSFLHLGLTDAVLVRLTQEGAQLLTTDLGLHLAVLAAGQPSVNFNEIRNNRPGFS